MEIHTHSHTQTHIHPKVFMVLKHGKGFENQGTIWHRMWDGNTAFLNLQAYLCHFLEAWKIKDNST